MTTDHGTDDDRCWHTLIRACGSWAGDDDEAPDRDADRAALVILDHLDRDPLAYALLVLVREACRQIGPRFAHGIGSYMAPPEWRSQRPRVALVPDDPRAPIDDPFDPFHPWHDTLARADLVVDFNFDDDPFGPPCHAPMQFFGWLYGYPPCCVEWFITDGTGSDEPAVHHPVRGHVLCPACREGEPAPLPYRPARDWLVAVRVYDEWRLYGRGVDEAGRDPRGRVDHVQPGSVGEP